MITTRRAALWVLKTSKHKGLFKIKLEHCEDNASEYTYLANPEYKHPLD